MSMVEVVQEEETQTVTMSGVAVFIRDWTTRSRRIRRRVEDLEKFVQTTYHGGGTADAFYRVCLQRRNSFASDAMSGTAMGRNIGV
jgi:hypothetical protein